MPLNLPENTSFIPNVTKEQLAKADAERKQFEAQRLIQSALAGAASKSTTDTVGDTVKNIISGALTGITDTASFVTSPIRPVSKFFADVSDSIEEASSSLGSIGERSQAKWYQIEQAQADRESQAQYERDLAEGKDSFTAGMARIGRDAWNAAGNAFKTGHISQVVSSSLGSAATDIALAGGAGMVAKGAAKALPSMAAKTTELINSSPRAQKLAGNLPWMTSVGLQEGGNQYRQQLNEVLDTDKTSDVALMQNSPEYAQLIADGMTPAEAREELAFRSARLTGALTAALAAGIAPITKWAQKPLEVQGKSAKKLLGEALTEPVEETATEGGGQVASNLANQAYINKDQSLTEGVGESMALGGIGGLGMASSRAPLAAGAGVAKKVADWNQDKKKEEDNTKAVEAVSSSATSIKEALSSKNSDLGEAVENLSSLNQRINSKTKTNDEGKEVEKTSADLVSELDEIDRQWKNSEKAELKEGASEKQKKNVKEVQDEVQKQLVKMKFNTDSKLKKKGDAVIKKLTKVPNANLSEQELEDLGNSTARLDKQQSESVLNSLSDSVKTQLLNHEFINPSVSESIKGTLKFLAGNQTERGNDPLNVAQTKVERPKLKSALSEEDTPKPASETGAGILASIKYKNKEGKNKTAHFVASQGAPAISADGKIIPLSTQEFSRVQNSQDPDVEIAKVMSEHLEGTTDLDSYHTFNSQSFKVTNSKTKKYQIIKTNSDNFESGKQSIPMNQEARSVFFNPEATNEDKAEALRRQFDDYDAISVEALDESRAAQTLISEASTQAEIQKAYRDLQNMDKTVSFDEDGSLVIEDAAPEEENQKVKEAFGSLGDKVKAVKRPSQLIATEAPLTALEDILSSREKTEKFLRANKNTQAAGLLRKLFEGSDIVTNRGYLSKDDNLASQIVSFFNTDSGFIKSLEPALKKAFQDSEALKGIVLSDTGSIKNNFLEMFELVAGHWLATTSAFPHALNQQELQRWNINADANQHFMQASASAGLFAPMALQNLQTNLKRFMGVSFENTADINEVDKLFGEMASRIADAMIDAKLLKVHNLEYVVPTYNNETHEMEYTKTAEAPFFQIANPDYKRIFQAKADILDALLNPTYKNRINYVPPKTRRTIVGTSIAASDSTIKAIEKANSIGAKINLPWLRLVASLGGNAGISRLFGFEPNEENRKLSVQKAWETQNGKYITRQTGFDHILEAIANKDPKTKLEDLQIYFSNAAIVNGRIMQEGAATYQNNKFLRQAYMYTDGKEVDLTDPETLKVWKSILAQKLGESVNKKDPKDYLSKVDKVIDFIKNSGDIQSAFNAILDGSNDTLSSDLLNGTNKIISRNQRQQIADWIQSFNSAMSEEGYAIQDEEALNAALEVFRYLHEDQKKFVPHIFLEIDGTNDGVSWANRLFGISAGAMGPNWVKTNAKTGFMPLVSTYSQALLSNSEIAKLLGTDGKNIHEQVSQEDLPRMLKHRVQDALSRKTDKQAQLYLKATRAFLDLADAVGWIKTGSVNDFMSGKGDITFTKDISKKLTTIILYGSQIKGSTGQIVDMLFDGEYGNKGIYARISDMLGDITKIDKSAPNATKAAAYGQINAKYQQIRSALEALSKIQTKKDNDFKDKQKGPTYTYIFSDAPGEGMFTDLVDKLPGIDTLDLGRFKITSKNKVEVLDLEKDSILQNFALTNEGRAALINTLVPVFGEPAYAAVTQAIGVDSLKAARAPMILGNIATSIAREMEATKLRDLNKKGHVTQNDLYKVRKLVEKVSPLIEYGGGAKVFAEKQAYSASQSPLYKGKQTATNFYPTRARIDSSGVAFGALTTQGLGDTTTAYQTLTKTSGNIGQVFDGYYTALNLLKEISVGANKGAREASLQRPIESIVKKLESVGKVLIKEYPEFKGKEPEEVIGIVLGRFANQQYIDGTPMSARDIAQMTKDGTKDIQDELHRSLTSFENDFDYVPSTFTRRNMKSKDHQYDPQNVMGKLKGQTRTVVNQLKRMAVVERVNHEVLDRLPQTFHHMAGDTTPYVQGKAMSIEDAKSIFETINNSIPVHKFKNFSEVVAAYLTAKANAWAEKNLNTEDFKRYKEGLNAARGDIAPRELDQKFVDLIDEKIGEIPSKIKRNPIVFKNPSHVVARGALIEAFNSVGDRYDAKNIFVHILNKAKYLLPKDLEIFMYSSKEDMPEDIRLHFENDAQQGIYIGGKSPKIYLIDQEGNGDWKAPKNQEVLVHEGIHAGVSSIINKWANDPSSVSKVQKQALDNLDSLLKDIKFLQWPNEHKPKVIDSLQTIIREASDKAERVDESLAYILSNAEVLQELSKATLNADRARKHNSKLKSLLDNLLEIAHKAWARLIGIITGSPVENYLKEPKNKKLSRDFIYYYGANTLTFFDENNYQKGKPDAELTKQLNEAAKKVEYEEPTIVRHSTNLKNEMNSGARGYLQKLDLGRRLFHKYYTDLSYEKMKSGFDGSKTWFKGVDTEARKKANEEVGKVKNYATNLAYQLSGLVDNPDETASAISKLLQEGSISPKLRKDLTNIYRQFQERLDPYFLVPDKKAATQEELAYSDKMYKVLTGQDHVSTPLAVENTPESFNTKFYQQAVFYGIALTDPTVSNALGELAYKPEKQVSEAAKGTFKRILADAANGILNSMQKEETKFKNAQEVYQKVADTLQKNVNLSDAGMERGIFNIAADKLNSGLMNIALFPFLKHKGWSADEIGALRDAIQGSPTMAKDLTGEMLRKLVNKAPIEAVEWLRELYGRTPSNSKIEGMLKEIRGHLDKTRKELLDRLPKNLQDNFNGKKFKAKDKKFLSRVLGDTNISVLDFNTIKEVLSNRNKLNQRILDLQAIIVRDNPNIGGMYVQKVKQLANYKMGNGKAGINLLRDAEAIAHLWNQKNASTYDIASVSETTVANIRTLITLQNLSYLTDGDFAEIQKYLKNHESGIKKLVNAIKNTLEAEQERAKDIEDKAYLYNKLNGWLPKGNAPKGEYIVVPVDKVEEYKHKGYEELGKVNDSLIEEPHYRMYNAWVGNKTTQEGILQCINQTLFGWQIIKGTNGEIPGSMIYDPSLVRHIQESNVEGYIPVFDGDGRVVGYERAIPKEDRDQYVDKNNDIFSGIAQYQTRQERESIAGYINKEIISLLKDEWDRAPLKSKTREFEDIFHTKNAQIKRAVERLDSRTLKRIREAFGGDHCWIKKDQVWTVLGYHKLSVTDAWDNKFFLPAKVEQALSGILDLLVPNGKAQAYIQRGEAMLMGAATWARETIIIRSGFVPLMNAVGNVLLLMMSLRMPPATLYKLFKECLVDTERYNTLRNREIKLKTDLLSATDEGTRKRISRDIENIQLEYKNLPIFDLIKAGEFSTIDNEGTTYEPIELQKMKWGEALEHLTSRVNPKLQTTAKNILMTKDSDTFQALAKFTNYGDWLAKAVAYRYLTEPSNNNPIGMQKELARNVASTLFVDYDQFVGPERDWFNRIGLSWFLTFKYRMLSACTLSMFMNPGLMVLGTAFESAYGLAGTPLSDNIITKLFNGGLFNSTGWGMIYRAVGLHPAAYILGS